MISDITSKRKNLSYRILSCFIAVTFISNVVLPPGYAQLAPQTVLNLPAPGTMVSLTAGFAPALVKGITINPDNPLQFEFFISKGDSKLGDEAFKEESRKLIKYFLASLTVPEEELWVNLSPYEKDRIIPQGFGETEMGRDMLAQDYILKQLTASLMYPEEQLGKKFWDKVYQQAQAKYGTAEIPVDTFNKVWIVPDKAVVYEHGNSVFVVESRLKVMLEQDYQAMGHNVTKSQGHNDGDMVTGDLATTQIIREVIIPALEKEVNEGKGFANLRQIYNSSILAVWYKQKLTVGAENFQPLLGQIYVDKNKTKGIDVEDKTVKQKIYDQYLEAFQKGVYNYIKEDYDPATRSTIPRKYFSGGTNLTSSPIQITLSAVDFFSYSRDRQLLILDSVNEGEYELVLWEAVENATRKEIELATRSKLEPAREPAEVSSLPITIDIRAYEKGGSVLAEAKMKILSELVKRYGSIPDAVNSINEAESIAREELLSLDHSTEGFEKVARGTASAEDKEEYLQSRMRGEWAKFLPAGGDATRLGVKEQKVLLDLKDLLSDSREEELEEAIEKALRNREITSKQKVELVELRESVGDELKHKTIIARILESEAKKLGGTEKVLERQTYILAPSAGHEQKLADDLSKNSYFGFGREAFFILPQEQEPKYQQKDGTIVAIDKQKAGGNGVPIINIVLEGKGYTIGEDGKIVPYPGKASQYAQQRGAKYIYQGTIGDLRPWIADPLHAEFAGRIFGDLSSGKIAAAAEYAQQNPTLAQKGGTVFYNRKTEALEFVEKLAMGRMLNKVDFERQPLATFNHIFAIEALESIRGRRIPLYVRPEDGEFFTELVGGDIVNILQSNGYRVAHVERRVQIHELKGTASLIPTVRTAYMQDTGRKYLEKKPLTAVSLQKWIKGATLGDKALPALIALNKETSMGNLSADEVFSLVALYRYFDHEVVGSMLEHEGMWDFDVVDGIFKRFKDVLTEHPELIDGIREKMAGRQIAGKPLTAVNLQQWIKGATPGDKALPALIALNKETSMGNLSADEVFSLVALYRYFDPGFVGSMLDREGAWDFDVGDRIYERFKDILTEHPELIDVISARAAASSPVAAVLPRVNPTATASWLKLKKLAADKTRYDLRELFDADPERAEHFSVALDGAFKVDLSKNLIDEETLSALLELAGEVRLKEAIEQMFNGEKINETENRAVLHTALRNVTRDANGEIVAANGPVYVDGKDVMPGVIKVLNQMKEFTNKVRSGEWKGATGKAIKHVVNVGIGGSDLGPKMAAEVLKPFGRGSGITAHFVSNVDGTAAAELIRELGDPEETLIVIESKTFTTQETIQNAMTFKNWVNDYYKAKEGVGREDAIKKHFVAVSTARDLVEAFGIDPENMFAFWDWVGGRYSMWSAIGLTLATSVGFDNFSEMLEGAREADEHFRNRSFDKNIPVLKALLGVWNRNFLNAETNAILPYDEYSSLIPAFLQQGFMESQGKGTDRSGNFITDYDTGQIIFGAAGTDGQHSFYQLIHQSPSIVPADFIGIARTKNPLPGHHEKLYSNFVAQPYALAFGSKIEEVMKALDDGKMSPEELRWLAAHRTFPGNKPTTSIFIDEMTPRALGKLIAMYEHQIMAEGIIYNIFSFDQWGVQLGKVVATKNVLDFLNGTRAMKELNSVPYGNTIRDVAEGFIKKQPSSSPVGTETRPLEQSRPSSFGTSGDRGIIGKDFDFPLIHKLGQGTALYAKENYPGKATLIGRDTRRMNAEFQRETAAIHAANGIPVIVIEDEPVPTPVLAFLAGSNDNVGGVINLTASHSPYTDGGFKFSPSHGGAADQETTDRIQELSNAAANYQILDYEEAKKQGLIKVVTAKDAVDQYVHGYIMPVLRETGALNDIVSYIKSHPDFELVLDPMQGTGVRVMQALYAAIAKEAGREFFIVINENNKDPEFKDVNGAPQPDKYTSNGKLIQKVKERQGRFGLSVDGDVDRFGTVDFNGDFFGANDLIALLAFFLKKDVGLDGAIGKTVATSDFVNAVSDYLGSELDEEKVGFKWFVAKITNGRKYLVAGEESAHVGVGPFMQTFDDGFAVGLTALWMVAKSNMSLADYKDKVEAAIQKRFFVKSDTIRRADIDAKQGTINIVQEVNAELSRGKQAGELTFAKKIETKTGLKADSVLTKDGVKLFFEGGNASVLLRPSGTEPAGKLYTFMAFPYEAKPDLEKLNQLYAVVQDILFEASPAASSPVIESRFQDDEDDGSLPPASSPVAFSKQTIDDIKEFAGKVFEVRVDFNVQMKNGDVADDTRIRASLPLIKEITSKGGKVILTAHLGDPQERKRGIVAVKREQGVPSSLAYEQAEEQVKKEFTLAPIAKRLKQLLAEVNIKVHFNPEYQTPGQEEAAVFIASVIKNGEVLLLENVRFNAAEEILANAEDKLKKVKTDTEKLRAEREVAQALEAHNQFAEMLFKGVDVFVFDGFGVSHRRHVSVVGAPNLIPRVAGPLVRQEVVEIRSILPNLNLAIMGGSKVSDKIKVLKRILALDVVETVLIGGAMANSFLKAKDYEMGNSFGARVGHAGEVDIARELLSNPKIVIPVDGVIASEFEERAEHRVITFGEEDVPPGWLVVDIGPKTRELYAQKIRSVPANNSLFWNGPMGAYDKMPDFAADGTKDVAQAAAEAQAYTVVGGGDSAAAVNTFKIAGYNYVSTGGGASLKLVELPEGEDLPAIAALSPASASSPVENRRQSSDASLQPTTDDGRLKTNPGGINLDPALLDLQIRRDANFVPLPLPQQPIGEMRIDGFVPVIINITPVSNLPMLLGLVDTEPDAGETSTNPALKAREPEEISALN